MPEKTMSISTFCARYGFTRYAAYILCNNKKDKFPCLKVGSRYYIFSELVDDWLAKHYGDCIK